jgi:hypothetical protein
MAAPFTTAPSEEAAVLYRLSARCHTALIHATDRLTRSGLAGPRPARPGLARGERGQGTVEYVALVLLVGVVLASVVAIAGSKKFNGNDIATTIVKKIHDAMNKVK